MKLTIEIPPLQTRRLAEMQEQSDAVSPLHVLQKALAVFDLLLAEKARGGTLVLRSPDGIERDLIL